MNRPLGFTAHLFVTDADAAAAFYVEAFQATQLMRNTTPDGTVVFLELALGPARLLIGNEVPVMGALAPTTIGGSPVLLTLELDDVDEAAERAIALGAEVEIPVDEMFWGERYGVVRDPFGHRWALTTNRGEFAPSDIAEHTPPEIPPPS